MTKEQQDKLRRALYNAKFTTDAEDENPFVGVYFNDLLDTLHDFFRFQWIPVEEERPKFDWKDDGTWTTTSNKVETTNNEKSANSVSITEGRTDVTDGTLPKGAIIMQ